MHQQHKLLNYINYIMSFVFVSFLLGVVVQCELRGKEKRDNCGL